MLEAVPACELVRHGDTSKTDRGIWMDDAGDLRFVARFNDQRGDYSGLFLAVRALAATVIALEAERDEARHDADLLATYVGRALVTASLSPGESLIDPPAHILISTVDRLRRERDETRARVDQLMVQLGACATATQAGPEKCQPGDYGWSPAYAEVVALRVERDRLRALLANSEAVFAGALSPLDRLATPAPAPAPAWRWERIGAYCYDLVTPSGNMRATVHLKGTCWRPYIPGHGRCALANDLRAAVAALRAVLGADVPEITSDKETP